MFDLFCSLLYPNWFFLCFFRCNCNVGYTGINCESVYVPCQPSPCKNGGTCHGIDHLSFTCTCPSGKNKWNLRPQSLSYVYMELIHLRMKASDPKWVNPKLNIIVVNLLSLGGLQIIYSESLLKMRNEVIFAVLKVLNYFSIYPFMWKYLV